MKNLRTTTSARQGHIFALALQPSDYQISVHLNNLVAYYGKENLDRVFRHEVEGSFLLTAQLCNLRTHFGIAPVRKIWDIICPAKKNKVA
jgi:hypothetical protein